MGEALQCKHQRERVRAASRWEGGESGGAAGAGGSACREGLAVPGKHQSRSRQNTALRSLWTTPGSPGPGARGSWWRPCCRLCVEPRQGLPHGSVTSLPNHSPEERRTDVVGSALQGTHENSPSPPRPQTGLAEITGVIPSDSTTIY